MARPKRIMIGTVDGRRLNPSHFGMSPVYVIYELGGDGTAREVGRRPNPWADPEVHKHARTEDIVALLRDGDVFIGKSMGKKSRRRIIQEWGKEALLCPDLSTAEEALQAYIDERLQQAEIEA